MLKSVSAFTLVVVDGAPSLRPTDRTSLLRTLPSTTDLSAPERHAIEVVRPPYIATSIITGARFVGRSPSNGIWSWAAGERIKLLAVDWNARC